MQKISVNVDTRANILYNILILVNKISLCQYEAQVLLEDGHSYLGHLIFFFFFFSSLGTYHRWSQ